LAPSYLTLGAVFPIRIWGTPWAGAAAVVVVTVVRRQWLQAPAAIPRLAVVAPVKHPLVVSTLELATPMEPPSPAPEPTTPALRTEAVSSPA
jgi:hypothetical protein